VDGSAPLANQSSRTKQNFSRSGTIKRETSTFGKKPREIRFGGRSGHGVV
jgi:hypothetical protein